jgi:hypothetical protein
VGEAAPFESPEETEEVVVLGIGAGSVGFSSTLGDVDAGAESEPVTEDLDPGWVPDSGGVVALEPDEEGGESFEEDSFGPWTVSIPVSLLLGSLSFFFFLNSSFSMFPMLE